MPRCIRLRIMLTLTILLSFVAMLVVLSYPGVGTISEVGTDGLPLFSFDRSAVPQSVVEDASELAERLLGSSQDKADKFVGQVLATYSEAKDKNFVIVFSPGGWGRDPLENSPDWEGIFAGIKSELESFGYRLLSLEYKRTEESWRGRFQEVMEVLNLYHGKAKYLAASIEFLTKHIPHLRIILAGESTGAVISDEVMAILGDNPQVYSIETGPPFWHRSATSGRALVLTSNGIVPDSFSRGDFITIVSANLKALFGLSQPAGDNGTILRYIRAPGHEYRWEQATVYAKITSFLKQNFGMNHDRRQ
jgi:hypothetical protein